MSDLHVQRLRAIRAEWEAAKVSVAFMISHQHDQAVIQALAPPGAGNRVSIRDVERSRDGLEATYFIRLHAEFEGLLKEHLKTQHPHIRLPPNPKVDWLLSRVLKAEGIIVDPTLRKELDVIRAYRNDLAHHENPAVVLTFYVALSNLNRLVARLP